MHLIDCDQTTADELVSRIAANLPIGAAIGRIRAASPLGLLVDYGDSAAVGGIDGDGIEDDRRLIGAEIPE